MKAVLLTLVLLVGGVARAGTCGSDSNVQAAVSALDQIEKEVEVGAATRADLAQAQTNLAESKLCIDPLDVEATASLIEATKANLAYTKDAASVGSASMFEVTLTENKIAMLKTNCATLTNVFDDRESIGDVSHADVQTLKAACDSL